MSLPAEVLKKVKLLEISTRRLVNNLFAGEYHSAFKGQGMTFFEFREYVPGDDVRAIAWSLTARTGKPYIKKYDEEREMTLLLAVDVSGSSEFGTKEYFKGEIITHLAALLSYAAAKNKDPVGLLLFSDQVEHYIPPRKGRGQVYRILRDLFYHRPRSRGTNIGQALEYLRGVLKKRAHIFLFSDFMDEEFGQALRMMGKKHDAVAVVVSDPAESQLPDLGVVDLEDPETGELVAVDTSSPLVRKEFEKNMKDRKESRDSELKRSQVERIDVSAGQDYVQPLVRFFQRRNRR